MKMLQLGLLTAVTAHMAGFYHAVQQVSSTAKASYF